MTELEQELKLEAALDAVLGHMTNGHTVEVKTAEWLRPGSYMYDDRNPTVIYASPDVVERLKELLPNGVG